MSDGEGEILRRGYEMMFDHSIASGLTFKYGWEMPLAVISSDRRTKSSISNCIGPFTASGYRPHWVSDRIG